MQSWMGFEKNTAAREYGHSMAKKKLFAPGRPGTESRLNKATAYDDWIADATFLR